MLSPIREGILELTLSVNSKFTKSQVEYVIWKQYCVNFANLSLFAEIYKSS
jgi:hypothetical protein